MLTTLASGVLILVVTTIPVVALINRVIVGSEIRPDAPRLFRQAFWIKASELTKWGLRARLWFRIYWLILAAALGAVLIARPFLDLAPL